MDRPHADCTATGTQDKRYNLYQYYYNVSKRDIIYINIAIISQKEIDR